MLRGPGGAETGGRGDHPVAGVVREEGPQEELPAEHRQFSLHRQDLRLVAEVVRVRHEHGPGRNPEGRVLDGLEGLDGAGAGVGEPDWGGVGDEGLYEGFVSDPQGFRRLSPTASGQDSHNVESWPGPLCEIFHVGRKRQMGVEGHPEDLRVTAEG